MRTKEGDEDEVRNKEMKMNERRNQIGNLAH